MNILRGQKYPECDKAVVEYASSALFWWHFNPRCHSRGQTMGSQTLTTFSTACWQFSRFANFKILLATSQTSTWKLSLAKSVTFQFWKSVTFQCVTLEGWTEILYWVSFAPHPPHQHLLSSSPFLSPGLLFLLSYFSVPFLFVLVFSALSLLSGG